MGIGSFVIAHSVIHRCMVAQSKEAPAPDYKFLGRIFRPGKQSIPSFKKGLSCAVYYPSGSFDSSQTENDSS